jgi:hypothetical protein
MKKKHRDIVVDGVKYAWYVDRCCNFTIWKDCKKIYSIGLDEITITPQIVADKIKEIENGKCIPTS